MSGRGLSFKSKQLIAAAADILQKIQPASVRAVCYQLFARGVISSMRTGETQKVSRLLVYARENEIIPWSWIVDETRAIDAANTWDDLADYGVTLVKSYRRDFWKHQPERVLIVSEKGTIRGTIRPVLDEFAVPFLVLHGFGSATSIYELAELANTDERALTIFYVGDWDPSGLWMSQRDLPERLDRYGAVEVDLRRIALVEGDLAVLPSFDADTKATDSRHAWFTGAYGHRCYELDALPPDELRNRVRTEIIKMLDLDAWNKCAEIEAAEIESIKRLDWKRVFSDGSQNTRNDGGAA